MAQDYSNWDIIDFARLESDVLVPFLAGNATIKYGHFDWSANAMGEIQEIAHDGLLIVEGVGLFRPDLNRYLGYKIWVDCPIEEAILRGKKRDREEYKNPQDESWDGIWKRNDAEYLDAFKPQQAADWIFDNAAVSDRP
ncbi:MAG: hypothetical protein JW395_1026 [Nitrospira sp.]|nr:hypothetical protein [Nitrospira sp.]